MTQLSHPRYAVEQLYSAAQAATEIKASKRTVARLCQTHKIGKMVGNSLILTDDDVKALEAKFQGKPGNMQGFAAFNAERAKKATRKKSKGE